MTRCHLNYLRIRPKASCRFACRIRRKTTLIRRLIVTSWGQLPAAVKTGIMAMVRAVEVR